MLQLVLIGFAEAKMLCTGEYQSPVLSRYGKINFEAMSRCNDVGEGPHRGSCCRCVDDHVDLVITQGETLLEAENVCNAEEIDMTTPST